MNGSWPRGRNRPQSNEPASRTTPPRNAAASCAVKGGAAGEMGEKVSAEFIGKGALKRPLRNYRNMTSTAAGFDENPGSGREVAGSGGWSVKIDQDNRERGWIVSLANEETL